MSFSSAVPRRSTSNAAASQQSDAAISAGIEARLHLNEDRSVIPLCRSIYAFLDQPQNAQVFQAALDALDNFVALEVNPEAFVTASIKTQFAEVDRKSQQLGENLADIQTSITDSSVALHDAHQLSSHRNDANLAAQTVITNFVDGDSLDSLASAVQELRQVADYRRERTEQRKRKLGLVVRLADQISS